MKTTLKVEDFLSNRYYKESPENFQQLLKILNEHSVGFSHVLVAQWNVDLLNWINKCTPLLQNTDYKFAIRTKIFWILNQIEKFPQCQRCGKDMDFIDVLSIEEGYRKFCSQHCARPTQHINTIKRAAIDENLAPLSIIDQLKYLVENFEDTYPIMINSRPHLKKFVEEATPCLKDPFYKCSTKLYWIFNGIKSWKDLRVCCKSCKRPLKGKNIGSIHAQYPRFCNQVCKMKDEDVRKQIAQTCIENYGTSSPAQNYDIQKKSKKKYLFNGKIYDSTWEIAYEIYNRDAGKVVIYSPPIVFEYLDEKGTKRKYFPDFEVDGKLIEIKGSQFICSDGKFCNPYDHSLDARMEAKHQCAIKNGVQIVSTEEIRPCLRYVEEKYGNDFLASLSTQSKEASSIIIS